MKKDRQQSWKRSNHRQDSGSGDKLVRTTLFLGDNLSRNLDLLAIQGGKSKGELIREVMADYLRSKGFKPDRRPVAVKVTYQESE